MAELEYTGFPVLPEGRIWRVKEETLGAYTDYGITFIDLELVVPDQEYVKKRFLRKSVIEKKDIVLGHRSWRKGDFIALKDQRKALLDAAQEILERRANRDLTESLLGDYPPKKLF